MVTFVADRHYPFTTEVSVRFAETDAQGIAHNSIYLVWFELARVEDPRLREVAEHVRRAADATAVARALIEFADRTLSAE